MTDIQTLDGRSFTWTRGRGVARLESLGFTDWPKSFQIRSHRTNRLMTFTLDHEENVGHEFFDGEGMAFIANDQRTRVHLWLG